MILRLVSSVKIGEKHLLPLREAFPQVDFIVGSSLAEVRDALREAEVFVTYGSDLGEEELRIAEKLKWIQVFAAGVNRMPLEPLRRRGITVANARGVHAVPITEYVFGMMLQHVRQLPRILENQRIRCWDRSLLFAELCDKHLGIVGVGSIGQRIAAVAQAFGMNVVGVNRSGQSVPGVVEVVPVANLRQILPRCDFLVLVLPSTPETRGLIGASELAQLPPHAVLINVARGDVVDETALLGALREKRLARAILDVFAQEPLPPEHPFWEMENVWISPHSAGLSPGYTQRCVAILRENLTAYFTGEAMRNQVDLSRGY